MFKRVLLAVALLAVVAPAALCQAKINLDAKKATFMVPTGIFVPRGETITLNATGTVTLTDVGGAGFFTVNADGVIQTAPNQNADKSFYSFLTDQALPPLLPPSPGELKFPPGGTGATLVGAYGALVLGLSSNQCGATSTADFPQGFVNPGTGGGGIGPSGGYIYLGVQRDNEVAVSGTYAVTISLSGSASPPVGCTGALDTLDPVPNFLVSTGTPSQPSYAITTDQAVLTSGGRAVTGVAADGVAQVLVRSQGMDPTHLNVVVLLDENGQTAPGNGEDGLLFSLFGGAVTVGSAVIPAIQNLNGINYIFVAYHAPIDYLRESEVAIDAGSASRKIGIVVFDTTNSTVVGGAQLDLLRPPVFFVHGIWSSASTWEDLDTALQGEIPNISTFRAEYKATNGDWIDNNARIVIRQAQGALSDFKSGNNPTKGPAAAAQLDFVVHSMGGLISDHMALFPNFRVLSNYGRGRIHKLITIDTPYLGSLLATGVKGASAGCQDDLNKAGKTVGGAIMDLAVGSPFLQSFNAFQTGYPKHAIASIVNSAELQTAQSGVVNLFDYAPGTSDIADCSTIFQTPSTDIDHFSFISYYQTSGDPYQGANDLIVSELSQLGPIVKNGGFVLGSTADETVGLAHGDFPKIPGALDAGPKSPITNLHIVVGLLNTSATDSTHFLLP